MNTDGLTLAQRMVLRQVDTTPRTVTELRQRLNLPRTSAALDNVNAALADLVAAGLVVRHVQDGVAPKASRYSVDEAWEAGHPCPVCGGDTLAARPGHPEEEGDYCEACGTSHERPETTAANARAALGRAAQAVALEVAQASLRQAIEDHRAAIDARDECESDLAAIWRLEARAKAALAAAEARRVQAQAEAVEAEAHLAKVHQAQA